MRGWPEDNWLAASGCQIDGPRKTVGPHEKRLATSYCTEHGVAALQRACLSLVFSTILRRWTTRCQTPAGATYRQHGLSVLGRVAFLSPRSAELSRHPCSTPAGHPARPRHARNDKSMEEALVPAFRMIVNYVVNGLLGPRTAPWKAKHEARAREIEAHGDAAALLIQAEAHAEALKSVSSAYQDVAASPDFYLDAEHDLEGLVVQVMQHEHIRRQQNLLSVLSRAHDHVGDDHVSDHEPDPDWTSRFFSDVQDVSSEGMQALWAKILAGEVKRPGSTSFKTLGIMKDLDRSTATTFRRICSLSISMSGPDGISFDRRVLSLGKDPGYNGLDSYGLSYGTLNVLDEYGLITSDYENWIDYRMFVSNNTSSTTEILLGARLEYQSRSWILLSTTDKPLKSRYRFSGVALSQSGRELSRVVDIDIDSKPIADYDRALRTYFESKHLRLVAVS